MCQSTYTLRLQILLHFAEHVPSAPLSDLHHLLVIVPILGSGKPRPKEREWLAPQSGTSGFRSPCICGARTMFAARDYPGGLRDQQDRAPTLREPPVSPDRRAKPHARVTQPPGRRRAAPRASLPPAHTDCRCVLFTPWAGMALVVPTPDRAPVP